jgi:hypothetical protein
MTLANAPLFYALGWTLFHFLWQGSLIALAWAERFQALVGPPAVRIGLRGNAVHAGVIRTDLDADVATLR